MSLHSTITDAHHCTVLPRRVLNAPQERRPVGHELLPVARYASNGKELTAPRGLDVEQPIPSSVFKDPLSKGVNVSAINNRGITFELSDRWDDEVDE